MTRGDLSWPTHLASEPTSPARACIELCVFDVGFPKSGFSVDSRRFIERHSHGQVTRLRHLVRHWIHVEKRPRLICPLCGDPLNIAARFVPAGGHSFYFSHVQAVDHDKALCPYRSDRPDQSQIEAWKYHGQRESEAHRQMKARIARSLAYSAEMTEIVEEKVWIGPKGWRKPDVSATWVRSAREPLRLAFEAQLSTTFISTIIQRQEFYRKEGAALVWVLRSFDPTARRMFAEDILALNNSNVLVVSDSTEAASRASGKFMVEAHWHEPIRRERKVDGTWRSALVSIDELTVDPVRQCSFYVDVAARVAELRTEMAAEIQVEAMARQRQKQEEEAAWRREELESASKTFVSIMLVSEPYEPRGQTLDATVDDPFYKDWQRLRRTFRGLNIAFPSHPAEDPRLVFIVWAIVSAQRGHPVRWNYKKLVQVGHLLDDRYKFALLPFGKAVRAYGRQEQLTAEDTKGKWATRSKAIRAAIVAKDADYIMPDRWRPLLAAVFPEVFSISAKVSAAQSAVSRAMHHGDNDPASSPR